MDGEDDFRTKLVRDVIKQLYEMGEVDTPPEECTIEWDDSAWQWHRDAVQESDDGR